MTVFSVPSVALYFSIIRVYLRLSAVGSRVLVFSERVFNTSVERFPEHV